MRYLLLCLLIISLSSCFEILEQVKMNNDGSGTIVIKLNMSQSKSKMKSIMLMEKVNGHRVPKREEVEREFNQIAKWANESGGISNATAKSDFTDYIFTFSCDFKSTKDLNEMIHSIRKKKSKKTIEKEDYLVYSMSSKSLKRNFTFSWTKDFLKLSEEDKKVFKNATFTGVYKFEKEVVSNSNSKAKTAANKKAVMLKLNVMDVINKKETINNTIQTN